MPLTAEMKQTIERMIEQKDDKAFSQLAKKNLEELLEIDEKGDSIVRKLVSAENTPFLKIIAEEEKEQKNYSLDECFDLLLKDAIRKNDIKYCSSYVKLFLDRVLKVYPEVGRFSDFRRIVLSRKKELLGIVVKQVEEQKSQETLKTCLTTLRDQGLLNELAQNEAVGSLNPILDLAEKFGLKDYLNGQNTLTGETALHLAAARGSESEINILLRNGANSGIRSNEGLMPFQLLPRVKDKAKAVECYQLFSLRHYQDGQALGSAEVIQYFESRYLEGFRNFSYLISEIEYYAGNQSHDAQIKAIRKILEELSKINDFTQENGIHEILLFALFHAVDYVLAARMPNEIASHVDIEIALSRAKRALIEAKQSWMFEPRKVEVKETKETKQETKTDAKVEIKEGSKQEVKEVKESKGETTPQVTQKILQEEQEKNRKLKLFQKFMAAGVLLHQISRNPQNQKFAQEMTRLMWDQSIPELYNSGFATLGHELIQWMDPLTTVVEIFGHLINPESVYRRDYLFNALQQLYYFNMPFVPSVLSESTRSLSTTSQSPKENKDQKEKKGETKGETVGAEQNNQKAQLQIVMSDTQRILLKEKLLETSSKEAKDSKIDSTGSKTNLRVLPIRLDSLGIIQKFFAAMILIYTIKSLSNTALDANINLNIIYLMQLRVLEIVRSLLRESFPNLVVHLLQKHTPTGENTFDHYQLLAKALGEIAKRNFAAKSWLETVGGTESKKIETFLEMISKATNISTLYNAIKNSQINKGEALQQLEKNLQQRLAEEKTGSHAESKFKQSYGEAYALVDQLSRNKDKSFQEDILNQLWTMHLPALFQNDKAYLTEIYGLIKKLNPIDVINFVFQYIWGDFNSFIPGISEEYLYAILTEAVSYERLFPVTANTPQTKAMMSVSPVIAGRQTETKDNKDGPEKKDDKTTSDPIFDVLRKAQQVLMEQKLWPFGSNVPKDSKAEQKKADPKEEVARSYMTARVFCYKVKETKTSEEGSILQEAIIKVKQRILLFAKDQNLQKYPDLVITILQDFIPPPKQRVSAFCCLATALAQKALADFSKKSWLQTTGSDFPKKTEDFLRTIKLISEEQLAGVKNVLGILQPQKSVTNGPIYDLYHILQQHFQRIFPAEVPTAEQEMSRQQPVVS